MFLGVSVVLIPYGAGHSPARRPSLRGCMQLRDDAVVRGDGFLNRLSPSARPEELERLTDTLRTFRQKRWV